MSESDDETTALMSHESFLMDKLALKERRREMEEINNVNKINHLHSVHTNDSGTTENDVRDRLWTIRDRFVPSATENAQTSSLMLLSLEPLQTLSAKLRELRRHHGVPTCIAIKKGIAIGTSAGDVLIFNHRQDFVNALHAPALPVNTIRIGAVTALDISYDSLWLVAGHQSGALALCARSHLFIPT